jgi:hypothetical protein
MEPGSRDLNRCFAPPFEGPEGRLAKALLDELSELRPEALVDLHDTSGEGPAYGVATSGSPECLALTSHFASHMVLTDLRLGALMEAAQHLCPTVTIESGGAADPRALDVARAGLERYFDLEDPLSFAPGVAPPSVLAHPVRVQLVRGSSVAYADLPVAGVDLTLRRDVGRHNFDPVPPEEPLGWLGSRGLDVLRARAGDGRELVRELFHEVRGRLHVRRPLDLLMVATRPDIALADCLFYALPTPVEKAPFRKASASARS